MHSENTRREKPLGRAKGKALVERGRRRKRRRYLQGRALGKALRDPKGGHCVRTLMDVTGEIFPKELSRDGILLRKRRLRLEKEDCEAVFG